MFEYYDKRNLGLFPPLTVRQRQEMSDAYAEPGKALRAQVTNGADIGKIISVTKIPYIGWSVDNGDGTSSITVGGWFKIINDTEPCGMSTVYIPVA